jgi:hypothetical protein
MIILLNKGASRKRYYPIPVDSIPFLQKYSYSSEFQSHSSGFWFHSGGILWNPVIPAGMCGAWKSTAPFGDFFSLQ